MLLPFPGVFVCGSDFLLLDRSNLKGYRPHIDYNIVQIEAETFQGLNFCQHLPLGPTDGGRLGHYVGHQFRRLYRDPG